MSVLVMIVFVGLTFRLAGQRDFISAPMKFFTRRDFGGSGGPISTVWIGTAGADGRTVKRGVGACRG